LTGEGHGSEAVLADLGIRDTAVLLPSNQDALGSAARAGIADAVFRLNPNDAAAM
jgi:hypothetical protein